MLPEFNHNRVTFGVEIQQDEAQDEARRPMSRAASLQLVSPSVCASKYEELVILNSKQQQKTVGSSCSKCVMLRDARQVVSLWPCQKSLANLNLPRVSKLHRM